MAFYISPRQLSHRSELYHQLSQMLAAGITVPRALEQLRQHPPTPAYRSALTSMLADLGEGCTLSDAMTRLGNWTPCFDLALLQAGEQSGRLDACFRLLADYYRDRARVARQLIADLIYPAFLLHFAVLVFSFVGFVGSGNWVRFGMQVMVLLLPIYIVIFLLVFAAQSRHGETWRAGMERALGAIPVLGRARRSLALGRLAAALEALLNAGVGIIEAWEMAAAASGSPALRRAVLAWRPQVDAGLTPAEALKTSGAFPTLFSDQYATGELTGSLDETLRRLHSFYQEEGTQKLHAFAQWTPRAVYFCVMLLIAVLVVRWYANYFQQIGAAGGF
jgi:type II secretory pathway component PulF